MKDGGCILLGHTYETMAGVGAYEGRTFHVCNVCGKTEEICTVQPEDYAGLPTELGRSDHDDAGSRTAINAHDAGSSGPNSVCHAADPVNRTDLESTSAEIVGTRVDGLENMPASIMPGHIVYISESEQDARGFWPLFEASVKDLK